MYINEMKDKINFLLTMKYNKYYLYIWVPTLISTISMIKLRMRSSALNNLA